MLVIQADWSIVTQILYNETLPAIITFADKCVLLKHMLTISYINGEVISGEKMFQRSDSGALRQVKFEMGALS